MQCEEQLDMSSKRLRLAFAVGPGLVLSLGWCGSSEAAILTITDLGDDGAAGQLRTQRG